ncbi:hypothetical protein EC988_002283 [Linderina pennispora]|nr:hypothetical protein EC988_002283 [Linderina pennispora]
MLYVVSVHATPIQLRQAPVAVDDVVAASARPESSDERILRQDISSNCLPRSIQDMSPAKRVVIEAVARELTQSQFRDFHQFAPAALALNRPEIEGKILGSNYPGTLSGLLELRDYMKQEVPEISRVSDDANADGVCQAPTSKNLHTIFVNLEKLIQQFA